MKKETFEEKMKPLKDLGFETKETIGMLRKAPLLLKGDHLEKATECKENLETLGFSTEEIPKMVKRNPYILLIIKMGFQNTEVTEMIHKTPLLLTYDSASITSRLDYYQKKSLLSKIKQNSNYLLYSLELMKKREKIIGEKNIEDLFLTDQAFLKKYKQTREEVLKED